MKAGGKGNPAGGICILFFLMLCLTACAGGAESEGFAGKNRSAEGEDPARFPLYEEEPSSGADGGTEHLNEENLESIWLSFDELDFAMECPEDIVSQITSGQDDPVIFYGENASLSVELSRWDQVSDPNPAALGKLVSEYTGNGTDIVECHGRSLVRVNWPHGEVDYFLLASDGDAYELRITPYVMKDPEVYGKVKRMMESFCDISSIPENPEADQSGLSGKGIVRIGMPERAAIDYLVLVNGKNPLPEGWEEQLDLVSMVNSVGDRVLVERTAYKAYLELKADLAENEGIEIDLDSAYRSIQYQQEIMDRFTEKYGAAYARRTVATPGYSEHHTGLALDLYFRLEGRDIYENEDLVLYPEIWKKIHERLAPHGFILRYPGGEDGAVDYTYEPWHIRYVGKEAAREIMGTPGETLEDWLETFH